MVYVSKCIIAIATVFISVSIQKGIAIKCWQCHSNSLYCNDPFHPNNLTASQIAISLKECDLPNPQSNPRQIPVCKKIEQIVNDKFIISRSCYWKNEDAPIGECLENITPPHIKTEFCEICDQDGCNGSTKCDPVFLVITVPLTITIL